MSIRSLRPGEPVPEGEPRRYLSSHGYMRLRWTVAPKRQVETYEHRVIDGYVTTAPEVHHKNHDKTDNRPENLIPCTFAEHGEHHRTVDYGELAAMYQAGMSTPQIGAAVGLDAAVVFRALRSIGVQTRTVSESLIRRDVDEDRIRELHGRGVRGNAIAKELGVSPTLVHKRFKTLGLAAFPPGRPERERLDAD